MIVTDYIKSFIERLKWKAMCKRRGINPDTYELECEHEWHNKHDQDYCCKCFQARLGDD